MVVNYIQEVKREYWCFGKHEQLSIHFFLVSVVPYLLLFKGKIFD
jgi:hypothetical protein